MAKRKQDVRDWLQGRTFHAKHKRPSHPKGFEPGIRLDPKSGGGTVCQAVEPGQDPCWEPFLAAMGFEDLVQVLDVVEVRAWEVFAEGETRTLHYVKARVRKRTASSDRAHVDYLAKQLKRHKPRKTPDAKAEQRALVVPLADWQAGKLEGDGLVGLEKRLDGMIEGVARILTDMRPARLIVAGMGDMSEMCRGNYPAQAYTVVANRREQCRFVRHKLSEALVAWAPLAPEVEVTAVPGNHGRNSDANGKMFTTIGDNDDLAVFEQLAEAFSMSEAYQHVTFSVPGEDHCVTRDVYGQILGLAHGDQAGRGSTPQQKQLNWRKDMADTRHPIGDADVLVTGHYHHLQVHEEGTHEKARARVWLQCPTLDGGSWWWERRGGAPSIAGTLTFSMGRDGFGDLEVVR